MLLYKLSNKGYINQKGNLFLIETPNLIEGVSTFFAEEEKPFWSQIKSGDEIQFIFDNSPKFGRCLLISRVNEEEVGHRRILVHGANENGICTAANSANCLVPLKMGINEAFDAIKQVRPLLGYTKSWVQTQFEPTFAVEIKVEGIVQW